MKKAKGNRSCTMYFVRFFCSYYYFLQYRRGVGGGRGRGWVRNWLLGRDTYFKMAVHNDEEVNKR